MRRLGLSLSIAAACLAFASIIAKAGDTTLIGFRTPSGNIHCQYYDGSMDEPPAAPSLRCDMQTIDGPLPAKPKFCDGEWGRSFNVSSTDITGHLICIGDTVYNESNPVLQYGQTWQQGGFTCTSETSGLTCFNAKRHGFKLSKASRTVF